MADEWAGVELGCFGWIAADGMFRSMPVIPVHTANLDGMGMGNTSNETGIACYIPIRSRDVAGTSVAARCEPGRGPVDCGA